MTKNVYQLIAAVAADIAKQGIAKDRNNQAQGYKFRGIDDIYNALSPIMSKHGLVILPRILARTVTERTTPRGGVLFYVTVEAEFDFASSVDGSIHTVKTFGEAMDSGDKATNKAMSAAYKYAAFQTFCIPTEGDNDADAHTHVVLPKLTQDDIARIDFVLDGCSTLDELKKEFLAAHKAAAEANDAEAIKHFTKTKDEVKARLEKAQ
jgi:hypothetical protein